MTDIQPHAPAPWEVTPDGQAVKAVHGRPGMDPSELMPVAVLSPGVCRAGNARLIVAALDYHAICTDGLLEVLERAATDLKRQGDRRICIELCKFAQRIREANAKAAGEPA